MSLRGRVIFPLLAATSACLLFALSGIARADMKDMPRLSTYFLFRREDSSDDASRRSTALLGVGFDAKYAFANPGFGGSFSVRYDGALQNDEFVQSAVDESTLRQKYKVNLGLATSDGALSLSTELSTEDRYFRRDRFDFALSSDTYQQLSSTVVLAKGNLPKLIGAISTERSVGRKVNPVSSSVRNNASVSADWTGGPVRIVMTRARVESKNDLLPNPTSASEQTLVNSNGVYPLGGPWTLSHNFRFIEDARSSYFAGGEPSKSLNTFAQMVLEGNGLTPGLSARVELTGDQKTYSTPSSNSAGYSQSLSLNFNPRGELLGDDTLSFSFVNNDVDSGGRATNIRNYGLGWRFSPMAGGNVTVAYQGQTSTNNTSGALNDRRSTYDVRFSLARARYSLDGGYDFQVVEGAAGQESRTNALGIQLAYQVIDPLGAFARINHWENRNIPASPLAQTNVSQKLEWAIGARWRPVQNIDLNTSYQWVNQDNSASYVTNTRNLQVRLNYQFSPQVAFAFEYDTNDFNRVGDASSGLRNTTLQTTLSFTF